jgi:ribonucleoside-diphosphate reductase alpha chain
MQAEVQKHIENAVSKTVNAPNDATVEDIRQAFILGWKLGCKGLTVYRDGSKKGQPISFGKEKPEAETPKPTGHRPKIMYGSTEKIDLGPCGSLYITINTDKAGQIGEIFLEKGGSGSCAASHMEAMARWISVAIRHGTPIEKIIEQAEHINCDRVYYDQASGADKPDKITSCSSAIAIAVKRFLLRNGYEINGVKKYQERCTRANCPGIVVYTDGCKKCDTCGAADC